YHSLTENDRSTLLAEFANYKAIKSTGHRITVKSKVNDVTHTLKVVENEVFFFLMVNLFFNSS
ncbi:hypothetical protein BU15DRAFT_55522, partial [Melanogaster broomeanus]